MNWYKKTFEKSAQVSGAKPNQSVVVQQNINDFAQQMDSVVLPQMYSAIQKDIAGIVQRFSFTVSQMMKDRNLPENQSLNLNALYLISAEAAKATANTKGAEIVNAMKSSSVNNQNLALWRKRIETMATQAEVATKPAPSPTGNGGSPGAPQQGGSMGAGGSSGSMQSTVTGQ